MKYGKFDFESLIKKPTSELHEIIDSKMAEANKKRNEKYSLVGKIIYLQHEIDKT